MDRATDRPGRGTCSASPRTSAGACSRSTGSCCSPPGALEILAHRILWSLVFVRARGRGRRGWGASRALAAPTPHGRPDRAGRGRSSRSTGAPTSTASNSDRVVETSLGYFINPLVTVLLGVFVLRERLRAVQWAAIGIGGLAVGVLTVDYGHVPCLALTLAFTFGLYGLVKKRLGVRRGRRALGRVGHTGPTGAGLCDHPRAVTAASTFGHDRRAHRPADPRRGGDRDSAAALRGAANRIPSVGYRTLAVPRADLATGVRRPCLP